MEDEERRTVVKDSFQLLPPNPPDPQHNSSILLFIRTTGRLPRERGVGDGRIIGRDGRISGVVVATESVVWVSCSPWSMWKGSSGSFGLCLGLWMLVWCRGNGRISVKCWHQNGRYASVPAGRYKLWDGDSGVSCAVRLVRMAGS